MVEYSLFEFFGLKLDADIVHSKERFECLDILAFGGVDGWQRSATDEVDCLDESFLAGIWNLRVRYRRYPVGARRPQSAFKLARVERNLFKDVQRDQYQGVVGAGA